MPKCSSWAICLRSAICHSVSYIPSGFAIHEIFVRFVAFYFVFFTAFTFSFTIAIGVIKLSIIAIFVLPARLSIFS